MTTSQRVRSIYQQTDALRDASPTLQRINAAARAAHDIASPDGTIAQDELELVARELHLSAYSHLLDVGCGTGIPASLMAQRTHCNVVGIDVSLERLAQARTRIAVIATDASRALPIAPQTFDAAMQLDSIIHVADKATLLREFARVLKPNARLAICSTVGRELTADEMRRMDETPAALFRVTSEQLVELVRGAGFTLIAQHDRRSRLARWHAQRLQMIEDASASLVAEIGASETEKLLRRTRALVELLECGVVGSVLVIAVRC